MSRLKAMTVEHQRPLCRSRNTIILQYEARFIGYICQSNAGNECSYRQTSRLGLKYISVKVWKHAYRLSWPYRCCISSRRKVSGEGRRTLLSLCTRTRNAPLYETGKVYSEMEGGRLEARVTGVLKAENLERRQSFVVSYECTMLRMMLFLSKCSKQS